jgi:hypothetical protein
VTNAIDVVYYPLRVLPRFEVELVAWVLNDTSSCNHAESWILYPVLRHVTHDDKRLCDYYYISFTYVTRFGMCLCDMKRHVCDA